MNQSLLKYLLSGLEVMEKTSNYLPLKIHFSKVCVCVEMSGVCNYRENKAEHPGAF